MLGSGYRDEEGRRCTKDDLAELGHWELGVLKGTGVVDDLVDQVFESVLDYAFDNVCNHILKLRSYSRRVSCP